MPLRQCLFLFTIACALAQPGPAQNGLDLAGVEKQLDEQPAQELRVLSATLAAEQIDRAVLNRLMQEIMAAPADTATRLGVDSSQLHDIFTALSNAHGFINDNDMANVQAMCTAWNSSALQGMPRIEEALAAYERRAQFTRNFIAKYYAVVLASIEEGLDTTALSSFSAYMNDRRRRMAMAGATTHSAVTANGRGGEESIRFHCRPAP